LPACTEILDIGGASGNREVAGKRVSDVRLVEQAVGAGPTRSRAESRLNYSSPCLDASSISNAGGRDITPASKRLARAATIQTFIMVAS
jgi:hypothetical protein